MLNLCVNPKGYYLNMNILVFYEFLEFGVKINLRLFL